MKKVCIGLLVCAALCLASPPLFAQVRITGSISGTVTDNSDAVIPGATVTLTDEGTGATKETISNNSGAFQFPDLNMGSYKLTVALQGFQTAAYNKVVVESSRTTDLRVKLQVGAIGETITVEGASPVLETSSNVISSTLTRKDVTELPLAGRNAFTFARLVPGAVAPAGTGSTHYNGMPGGTINPTIDGVNNSSNGFKSGGTSFFGTVPARLGAVEEVTVESAGLGGDAGIEGGVNLKFITRRGTNKYRGSLFEQARNDIFNANTYSNTSRGIEKGKLRRHDFGGNIGGPVVPMGKWRDKMFFFINYEEEYIPLTTTRTQNLLTTEAQSGIFRYQTAAGEVRTANLLQIAAANGFPATPDPTIAALLSRQQAARALGTVNSINDLRREQLSWVEPQKQINYYPTARLDYQISPKLSVMGSWNLFRQDAQGRRNWPLPENPIQLDTFHSSWWITSTGLNWTVNTNTFNEFRYGVQHSGDTTPHRERDDFKLNGIVNGLPARFTLPLGLNPISADNAPITGRHYITTLYDTMTLLRGNHTLKFGANYRDTQWHDTFLNGAGTAGFLGLPRYSLGSPTGDPVQSIFNATSMPGISNNDLGTVFSLYGLLTGRLTQVATGKVVDPVTLQYSDQVYNENWTSSKFAGAFAQDSWRVNPNLTLNYAFRWEVSGAPYNHQGTAVFPDEANLFGPSTALFQPGVLNGILDPVMRRGKKAAGTDWVNPAPRVGFAWTPNFDKGILATIFGKGQDTVFRGGWDITYYDEGTNMFSSTSGNNPGQSQALLLQPGSPGFSPGGLTLQSPLPPFVASPLQYKDVWSQSDFTFAGTGFDTMRDELKTPSVQAWNIGIQRQLMKNTVIELRYIGNRSYNNWHTYNLNEVNTIENGFVQEFRNAQQNLAINQAAGVSSFQNRGLPGQVALPIFDAAFGARGAQPALSNAQGYTNGGFITNLSQGEAGRMANNMANNLIYTCRLVGNTFDPCASRGFSAAGPYPQNFFLLNPFAAGGPLSIVDDASFTRYHAMQLQLRRRYAGGLSLSANYTLGKNTGDIWADNATQSVNYSTLRDKGRNAGPTPFDVRHTFNSFGTYDLPFGGDRHFKIGNPVLDAIAGGWTVGGILTAQSGSPFRLSSGRQTLNQEDAGVILAPGVSVKDIQNMIHISPGPGLNRLWIDPQLIGPDGRANPAFLLPPTTPGELGQLVYLRSPNVWNFDMSLNKSVSLSNGMALAIHVTMQNVLNHPVWGTGLGFLQDANITSTTFGQTAQPANNGSPRNMYIRAEIRF